MSEDGEQRILLEAETLRKAELQVGEVISSPLLRAVQTAELVSRTLGYGKRIVLDPRLGPGFDASALRDILRDHTLQPSLLLVGHEPDMGLVLGECLGGGRIELKKGSLACVDLKDVQKPRGVLLYLLPPALLAGQAWKA